MKNFSNYVSKLCLVSEVECQEKFRYKKWTYYKFTKGGRSDTMPNQERKEIWN